MKEIQLTQGQVSKVCDCHYHLVEKNKWHAWWNPSTQSFYAVRRASLTEKMLGSPTRIYMHQAINGTPKGMLTDHRNQDTLDNQCSNLRTATSTQNHMNQGKYANNSSGYKGVSWHKHARKWIAHIQLDGNQKYLGLFNTSELAARAYDSKAIELFGEFASLNFPRSDYP